MKIIGLFFFIIFSFQATFATHTYEFNTNIKQAYQKIMDLKLNEAQSILNTENQDNSKNLMVDFMEDYIDYYQLLVDGSETKFKQLSSKKAQRLKRMDDGDILSPYYLYIKAEIRIHWAMLRSTYGDQLTAFRELRTAHKLLETNEKQFPDFMPNKKSLGMLETLFSAVPSSMKWSAKALGVSGDFDKGYRQIKEVLEYAEKNTFEFEEEIRIIYAFLLLGVKNDDDRAWQMINHSSINPKTSLLACYIQTMIAMKIGKNDTAIQLLNNRPKGAAYLNIPQIDYWLGVAKLQKLDKSADNHFKNYLNSATNDLYFKSSYLFLAYHEQLFGSEAQRKKYLDLCKTKGSTTTYDDKKALSLVNQKYPKTLLKAQLLINGGYYSEASQALTTISATAYKYKINHIRYYFLAGRAKHRQQDYNDAIDFYKKTLEAGEGTDYYYVIQSSFHLGELYELKKDYSNARKYYSKCLEMKSDRHQSSYHRRAKGALKNLR